jgi:hypothetical protein
MVDEGDNPESKRHTKRLHYNVSGKLACPRKTGQLKNQVSESKRKGT